MRIRHRRRSRHGVVHVDTAVPGDTAARPGASGVVMVVKVLLLLYVTSEDVASSFITLSVKTNRPSSFQVAYHLTQSTQHIKFNSLQSRFYELRAHSSLLSLCTNPEVTHARLSRSFLANQSLKTRIMN
ncbi:hypothetical protein PUN28_001502 [Cardiocondyla obscurior]|uniref:Uncharacterized protein n=1 Tax=Cardiocondyla obscurior TaxID=286306 RepID=A0AAW2H5D5_9HYME